MTASQPIDDFIHPVSTSLDDQAEKNPSHKEDIHVVTLEPQSIRVFSIRYEVIGLAY